MSCADMNIWDNKNKFPIMLRMLNLYLIHVDWRMKQMKAEKQLHGNKDLEFDLSR
jgi:hypothetical protein